MSENLQLDKLCQNYFGNTAYVADGIFHGTAEKRWREVNPRVLFVMKQPNSNDLLGEDYRAYGLDTMLGNQNWEQLLARLYGITHATAEGYPSYEEAIRRENLVNIYHTQPFAVLNIIKEEGRGTTDRNALRRYVDRNKEFIRRQIDILRPHVIVCCGAGVFDAVNSVMLPSVASSGNWVKQNMALGLCYFDTYHPGKPMAGDRLSEAYEKPLIEYVKTLKS